MKTYLMLGNCQSLRWRHYILLFIWNLCQTLNTGKLKVFNIYFPSQNTQPGAEEAFKILGHAFELIGEPVSLCCLKKVLHLIKNIDIFKISNIQKQRCSELIYKCTCIYREMLWCIYSTSAKYHIIEMMF